MRRSEEQLASLQAKASAEVDALLAQNSHSSKQVEVLQAELHRIKGGTTLSVAALQNEELQEVRAHSTPEATGCSLLHSHDPCWLPTGCSGPF
jgi:hypothetical protein